MKAISHFTSRAVGKAVLTQGQLNTGFTPLFGVLNLTTKNSRKIFSLCSSCVCLSMAEQIFSVLHEEEAERDEQWCVGWAVWGICHRTMSVRVKLRPPACQTSTCEEFKTMETALLKITPYYHSQLETMEPQSWQNVVKGYQESQKYVWTHQ